MAYNKVVLGEETLIDITDTTADEDSVLEGVEFYGADGSKKTGVVPKRKITDIEKADLDNYLEEAEVGEIVITEEEGGGGGGGGTSSWSDLENKPFEFIGDGLSVDEDGRLNSSVKISNPNLIDNPWFTVNQRGQKTYNGSGYTVDRWQMTYSSDVVEASNDGLSLSTSDGNMGYMTQNIPIDMASQLVGKEITLSVMLQDGAIKSATTRLPNIFPTTVTTYCSMIIGTSSRVEVRFQKDTQRGTYIHLVSGANEVLKLRAIKLEIGSVSTLANDIAPDYATELLKCQRYFFALNPSKVSYCELGFVRTPASSTQYCTIALQLPTAMRKEPTITLPNSNYVSFIGANKDNTGAYTDFAKSISEISCTRLTGNRLTLFIKPNDYDHIVFNSVYFVVGGSSAFDIHISADL